MNWLDTTWLNEKYAKIYKDYVASLWTWATQSEIYSAYKEVYQMQQEEKNKKEEDSVNKELLRKSVDAKDTFTSNNCDSIFITRQIANSIRDRVKSQWYDFSKVSDTDVVDWYLKKNPAWKNDLNRVTACEADLDNFLIKAWLEKRPGAIDRKETTWDAATKLAVWAWAVWVWTVWAWLWVLWSKTVWNVASWLYRQNLNLSSKDADIKVWRSANKKYLKTLNKDIAENQQLLKSAWEWSNFSESQKQSVENFYNDEIKYLKWKAEEVWDRIEKLSPENTPTTDEVAYKYAVKWWTPWQVAADAKAKSMELWDKSIQRYLDKSKQSVNIKDMLNSINVDDLSVEEWEKADLQRALDMVKNQYKDGKYWNLSLKEWNTLKSTLYEEVWDRVWKNQNVPWTALKKIRAKLSLMIKDDVQDKLSNEFWWDFSKTFKEWWALHNIATSETKTLEGKWEILWWKLSKISAALEAVSTPISSEWWYYLKKTNEWIRNVWKKAVEWLQKWAKAVKNFFSKDTVKKWAEAVKEWVKEIKKEPLKATAKAAKSVGKAGKTLLKDSVAWTAFEWVVKSWTPENAKNKNANKALMADTFINWRTKMNSKVYDSIDKSELKKLLNDESFIKYYWEKKINKLKEKLKEKSW